MPSPARLQAIHAATVHPRLTQERRDVLEVERFTFSALRVRVVERNAGRELLREERVGTCDSDCASSDDGDVGHGGTLTARLTRVQR